MVGDFNGYALTMFAPAVIISAFFLAQQTGYWATFLATFLYFWLLVPPYGSLYPVDKSHWIGVSVFIATNCFGVFLVESLHKIMGELRANMTRAQKSEAEKVLLLRDTAHRFRNDLQRLAATIGWQAAMASNPEVRDALTSVEARVAAMAAVQGRLDGTKVEGTSLGSVINSEEFLRGLAEDLTATIGVRPVTAIAEVESHLIPLKRAAPIGLIVNEMVTNSLKYAFPEDRAGTVRITFRRDGDEYVLGIADDGVGIKTTAPPTGTGLGLRIVRGFVNQIEGNLRIVPNPSGGTLCEVRFPV